MRPHVEALAHKTDECWRSRSISPGERALLCDMMVASASSADLRFQQQVLLDMTWRPAQFPFRASMPCV